MIKIKNKRVLSVFMITLILMVATTSTAFAINPGVKVGNWIQVNVAGLFIGLIAVLGIMAIVKRSLMQGITLLIFAGLGAAFIFNGTDMGQSIGNLISGWFK